MAETPTREADRSFGCAASDSTDSETRLLQTRFSEQWALANDGNNGGTSGADISAPSAWATTTGSRKIVVAVLDSGVDYTHPDLVNNMWKRPENVAEYNDANLDVIDDENGY